MATRYRDEGWLVDRLVEILHFYYPTCIDHQHGGYVAQIDPETGDIYDPLSKHLVATSRFIVNFCLGNR